MKKKFMDLAIKEAIKAYDENEIPVGCVIVKNNEVLAATHNTKEHDSCVICHAEIKAIIEASSKINDWRLNDCELYTTLFPCPMCSSAIQQARVSKVYYVLKSNDKKFNFIAKRILKTDNKCIIKKVSTNFTTLDEFFYKLRIDNVSRETLKNNSNNS